MNFEGHKNGHKIMKVSMQMVYKHQNLVYNLVEFKNFVESLANREKKQTKFQKT